MPKALTWNSGEFTLVLGFGVEFCDSGIASSARICGDLGKDEAVLLKGHSRAN